MRLKSAYLFIVFLIIPFLGKSLYLNIEVFSEYKLNKAIFAPISGLYSIEIDGLNSGIEAYKNIIYTFESSGDSILMSKDGIVVRKMKSVKLFGQGFLNSFSVGSDKLGIPKRDYDDHLFITSIKGKLKLVNNVELEHYVAGVVQSEGGNSKNLEYFYVQSVACRTYALVNYMKHKASGHNLCDAVHCQVYGGRCKSGEILRAVARTNGDVIVDENKHMISAAFHSNCGGQTVNSEDIWSIQTSYLKTITDTFCLQSKNATWTKHYATNDWLNILSQKYNYPIQDTTMRRKALEFTQDVRTKYFPNNIPLKDIRRDLYLRSTFFSIENKGDTIVLNGKGYGHGVGLCQQGAINMAQKGYGYKEIIFYYYTNTHIINYQELGYSFLKE